MTASVYTFPPSLHPLRDWLAGKGVDVASVKSDRQALHFASRLSRKRVQWPKRDKPCFPELQRLQIRILGTSGVRPGKAMPERAAAASPVRSVTDAVWKAAAERYGARWGQP